MASEFALGSSHPLRHKNLQLPFMPMLLFMQPDNKPYQRTDLADAAFASHSSIIKQQELALNIDLPVQSDSSLK